VTISIRHTNDSYGWQCFETEVTSMNLVCAGLFPFRLRESPAKPSLGQHKVRPAQGGCEVASSLDIAYEATFDNVNFIAGERLHNQQVQAGPCGVGGAQLHIMRSGPNVTIWWLGAGYRLEGSPNLGTASWTGVAGTSPITLAPSGPYRFFRLICP